MDVLQDAFYLPVDGGRRLCVWRAPRQREHIRAVMLHVPAFAEEMNKSRRMTAMTSRAFAARGIGVLQIDLLGTGDSSGDFGDAGWHEWTEDVLAAIQWLRSQSTATLWLWGLRAGALLIDAALPRIAGNASLLLWQPVASGRAFLTQFLRLKVAARLGSQKSEAVGTQALRDELLAGNEIEVAGYRLSAKVASGLEGCDLRLLHPNVERVAWIEVSGSASQALLPASQGRTAALRASGVTVSTAVVSGPPFWQTLEIEECPPLIDASLEALHDENARELSRDTAVL